MSQPKYPSLYQINTRVWLTELSENSDKPLTLDDIPEQELDRIASLGFDWIWFLSVWATGDGGRKVSLENKELRHELEATLPNLSDEDIGGSGFAIAEYHVGASLGGDAALKRLRTKLNKRGLKLMLDFVPNHMGPDHPWIEEHPDYFINGTEDNLNNSPQNYKRVKNKKGEMILAYGRDPYFSGWSDTFQIDYSNPAAADAMKQELVRIAGQCDGVRCDMAMLILPDIFERTWGRKAQPFWSPAIKAVREKNRDFCFMAEVYWDMEWTLQQLGFDYTYDKRLYDRLHEGNVQSIREHFHADPAYQDKMARFLENHDEPRVADAFGPDKNQAAAIITFLSTGLRFFHQGQFEGKMKRISPHLIRGPHEPVNTHLLQFYDLLLAAINRPLFRNGQWKELECAPAWDGNGSWNSFISFSWESDNTRGLVVVNYAPHYSQCFVQLPFSDLGNQSFEFGDLMSPAVYQRDGNDLLSKGIYVDLPPWGYNIFEITPH